MYHPETRQRYGDSEVRLDGTTFFFSPPKGSLIFGGEDGRKVLHAFSCIAGIKAKRRSASFSHGLLHGASHLISACRTPQLSVASFLFVRPDFWQCHCSFVCFPRGLHLVVKIERPPSSFSLCSFFLFYFQRYNNECTPTDWNKTRSLYQLTVV